MLLKGVNVMDQLQLYKEELKMIKIDSTIKPILNNYLVHLKVDIQSAIKSIREKDLENLHLLSHKVYGTAESYGLKGIGDIFKDIASFYSELNDDVLIDVMFELIDYVEKLQFELADKGVS
jgi:hypothetical protein